ncbi:MAG: heavy metal-responsive transcriptional regulator [Candidatus Flexifilum sp.]
MLRETTSAADAALYTRGQLAQAAGVGRETIRFYERSGLLPPPLRSSANYCLFPESAIERVRFIKRAQAVGFALDEIRTLLDLRVDQDATCGAVRQLAEQRIAEIDARIAALQAMRAALVARVEACPGGAVPVEACPILGEFEHDPCDIDREGDRLR